MNLKKEKTEQQRIAIAYFKSGVKKSNLNDYTGAIKDFNKATEVNPNYGTPYYNSAFIKMRLKDYSGAILDFNQAIALKPKNAIPYYLVNAYHNRGRSKLILEDYKGAITDFSIVIAKKSNFHPAYYHRGICKIKCNKKIGGALDLLKAKRLNYKIIKYGVIFKKLWNM